MTLRLTETYISTIYRLCRLARSLARPIRHGWLPIETADVALLLAADRTPDAGDLVDTWHELQDVLREELARTQPPDQAPTTATS